MDPFVAFRATKNLQNLVLESENNFNQSPPTFFRGQAEKRYGLIGKTVFQGSKCDLALKMAKIDPFVAFRAMQNLKNTFLESENSFNQSLPTLFRGQIDKRSPECAKYVSGGQNPCLALKWLFWGPKIDPIHKKSYLNSV